MSSPAVHSAVGVVKQWRLHSAKACNLYFHGKYEESLDEYRRALEAARQEKADPGVVIDLQLDIATVLTLTGRASQSIQILDDLSASANDDSLLAMRYWRRRARALAELGDAESALRSKKHVVDIMSKYFDATSPSYIVELYDYEIYLLTAKKLAEAVDVDEKLSKLLERNLTRFAREVCLRSLRLSAQRFEQCINRFSPEDEKRTAPSLFQRIEHIVNRSDSQPIEQIVCATKILHSPDPIARESAAKRILRVGGSRTEFEKEASLAALELMFLRIHRKVFDDETERRAKDAFERLSNPKLSDNSGKLQATTMYSMVLAKRGKLNEAERVVDTLSTRSDSMTDYWDLHPIYQARSEIAIEGARQHKPAVVKAQYNVLRAEFARQPRIPNTVRVQRLADWKNEEAGLLEASK